MWAAPSPPRGLCFPHPWWDTPQHAWLRPHIPQCPRPLRRPGFAAGHTSPFPMWQLYFFYYFFSQQKTPLILGWLKGFFFQQAFRCFFFFFLFSAFLSCRGKMKQFSLLGSCFLLQLGPAPQRGGRERGPEMLLPHCRVFGASSKQGGQYPGVPGCMCSEGDSLMSSKCCANVLPWVFLPPSNFACRRGPYARGDRPYAQADPPPNQAGGTPLAPGGLQGIPPPPSAARPWLPSVGVYRKRHCKEAPGTPAGVSVSFQPWAPKGPSLPRIRCESKPEPWGLTTSPRAAVSRRGEHRQRRL